jgi:ribosomal protein S18 acetylase RimI-like enzyme
MGYSLIILGIQMKEHNTEYVIRIAASADAQRISVLGAYVWLHTYAMTGISDDIAQYIQVTFTTDKILNIINDSNVLILVSEVGDALNGYIVIRFGSHYAGITIEIETLYVQDFFVSRGIGSALLEHAKNAIMIRLGNNSVWLTVNSQNERAISFYHSRGFVQDGVTYFKLGGKQHENIIMVSKNYTYS